MWVGGGRQEVVPRQLCRERERERTGQEERWVQQGRATSLGFHVCAGGGGARGDIGSIACDFGEGLFRGETGVG